VFVQLVLYSGPSDLTARLGARGLGLRLMLTRAGFAPNVAMALGIFHTLAGACLQRKVDDIIE